jgi:ketosteroid isomerase-like protein
MTEQQSAAATALAAAVANYDANAVAALLTPDATVIFPGRPAYLGAEGANQMINDLSKTYVDWKPQPLRMVGDGGVLAVEWTCTITDFGGAESRVDGCCVLDFHGSKIHRCRFYCRPEDTQQ